MELILVRHGLPERQELETGRADPPLSDTGHRQAALVAQWLRHLDIHAVYSSPMVRARQTAAPYAELRGHPVAIHEGVEEFGSDSPNYIPMEELKAQDYAAWKAFVDGDYENRVDIHGFRDTVVNALEEIVNEHRGQVVAVFCHGGVVNAWASHVLSIPTPLFFEPEYTSVHRFLCASTGERNIVSLNETAHLRNF